ncbi:GGDEF domain-containing protein [Amycolatopsis sp. NPDC088138]|uniref:sensor domain-containing diguanylate cyclase n=1 Tax=Amycolatopsis sp. NPDC088138 TaxID=3363938 RepID=UPI00382CEE54
MHPGPDDAVTGGRGARRRASSRRQPDHAATTAGGPPGTVWRDHPYSPRNWALWRRRPRVVAFILTSEAIALAVLAVSLTRSPALVPRDWINFGILAAGATIHIQLTQRQEERRRNRKKTVLIDLTAVWTFSAALILPAPLILLVIFVIRLQHWFIARRPAHNFIFSSITHGLAGVLAHVTYTALGPHLLGTGWTDFLYEFGAIVLTGAIYEAIQIVYVGGALALGMSSEPTVRNVLGSPADNMLEAITIGLGAVTAILLAVVPPMVAVMAVVTVVFNRLAELDQLQNDVRTDPKTGILNMRGWSETAERALERTARSGDQLALLMVDLDHFKWINDTYGHPAGDDVLRTVAQTLDEVTRPSDSVGRFGGEEFLILLPDIDEEATRDAAERIRIAIAKSHIVTTDKRGDPATIADRTTSIGVARYPRHGETLERLLQAADAAVYLAKENGRDQVSFAPDTPDELPAP